MSNLLHAVVVMLSQVVILILPPYITAVRLNPRSAWPETLLYAACLGLCSQGVLGLLWDHFVGRAPLMEAAAFLGLWAILSAVSILFRSSTEASRDAALMTGRETILLCFILGAAVVLRMLHPLQHWALGQSDAYSHLQFIQNVVAGGFIKNRMYPPGHAWIMALPAMLFNLDPYLMARYGGAFFGALLTLAVYVLLKCSGSSQASSLMGAYLAGLFPALNLLHKTAVGVFANQLGLALIPAVFYFYLQWRQGDFRRGSMAMGLTLSLALCAAATPMLLLHLFIILGAERMIALVLDKGGAWRGIVRLGLAIMPALAILVIHVAQAGQSSTQDTLAVLAQNPVPSSNTADAAPAMIERQKSGLPSGLAAAMTDYFSIKRYGYHQPVFDVPHGILLIGFAGCLILGAVKRMPFLVILGLWGGLTALQSFTGILQFSKYQREGWSLLIAVTVMGGLAGGIFYEMVKAHRWLRTGFISGLSVCGVWAFFNPPAHVLFSTAAEDDLVRWIKIISARIAPSSMWPSFRAADSSVPDGLRTNLPPGNTVMMVRRIAGHDSGQGELGPVVGARAPVSVLNPGTGCGVQFNAHLCYIILLEIPPEADELNASSTALLRQLSPEMAETFHTVRAGSHEAWQWVENFIRSAASRPWSIARTRLTPQLEAVQLIPMAVSSKRMD